MTERSEEAKATTQYGSIPTVYRNVRFRSRLEARWAAFFDLLGWSWEYEPVDLKGYIPDFILLFKTPLLVEVKPALSQAELHLASQKIERSGWDKEALIVGARLFPPEETQGATGGPVLGLLGERFGPNAEYNWEAAFTYTCGKCNRLTFGHCIGSYACRVEGCWDGDHYLGDPATDEWNRLWAEAQNEVQWRQQKDKDDAWRKSLETIFENNKK